MDLSKGWDKGKVDHSKKFESYWTSHVPMDVKPILAQVALLTQPILTCLILV